MPTGPTLEKQMMIRTTPFYIEFRHHEATLDALEFEHWIRFIAAIFHTGQMKAAIPTPRAQLGEEAIASWEFNISTQEEISDDHELHLLSQHGFRRTGVLGASVSKIFGDPRQSCGSHETR